MSADPVPSSKTNIFQNKLIYCRHFRTYSRCAMFDWSDTVFRRRSVTRWRISNTVLQPRYWGREADSPEVCRLQLAVAVGRQIAFHKENSGFAAPTLGWHISTFRGYRILFSIRNPYINRFTNHFSIHS
jgi:hypothetical protein